MSKDKNEEMIRLLCSQLETTVGRKLRTQKDFTMLCDMVKARTGNQLSYNTLRRVWGIVGGDIQPRLSTLSILSHFLGYHDWDAFVTANDKTRHENGNEEPSTPLIVRHIDVPMELKAGERLRLTWQPERVCDVEYDGSLHFHVLASQKTRLKPGDTFLCSLIVDGEPLYLGLMQKQGQQPMTYVCGKISGIRFGKIEN